MAERARDDRGEGTSSESEREFDELAAMQGIKVPAERRAGVLAGYVELRRLSALTRLDWQAEDEPALVFDPSRIVGSDGP